MKDGGILWALLGTHRPYESYMADIAAQQNAACVVAAQQNAIRNAQPARVPRVRNIEPGRMSEREVSIFNAAGLLRSS